MNGVRQIVVTCKWIGAVAVSKKQKHLCASQ